jgi:hypothetical protein
MLKQTKIVTFPNEQPQYNYMREDRRFYRREVEYPKHSNERTLQLIVHSYASAGMNMMNEEDANVGLLSYLVHGLGGFMGKPSHDTLARLGAAYKRLWLSKFALPEVAESPRTLSEEIILHNIKRFN